MTKSNEQENDAIKEKPPNGPFFIVNNAGEFWTGSTWTGLFIFGALYSFDEAVRIIAKRFFKMDPRPAPVPYSYYKPKPKKVKKDVRGEFEW